MLNDIIFVIEIFIVPLLFLIGYAAGEHYKNKHIRMFVFVLSALTNMVLILLTVGMHSAIGKTQIYYQSFLYTIRNELKSNEDTEMSYSSSTNVIKAIDYFIKNRHQTGDGIKSAILSTEYLKNLTEECPHDKRFE